MSKAELEIKEIKEIEEKIRNLDIRINDILLNEIPHINERLSNLERIFQGKGIMERASLESLELSKLQRTWRVLREGKIKQRILYDGLIGVLSFLSFISIFSTATGFFSLALGGLLSIASLIVLLLFVVAR